MKNICQTRARRALVSSSALTLAAIMSLGAAHAQSVATTYNVNQTIGAGSVVGQIVTDGKSGTLAQSDITSWTLSLNGVGATINLTTANSAVTAR